MWLHLQFCHHYKIFFLFDLVWISTVKKKLYTRRRTCTQDDLSACFLRRWFSYLIFLVLYDTQFVHEILKSDLFVKVATFIPLMEALDLSQTIFISVPIFIHFTKYCLDFGYSLANSDLSMSDWGLDNEFWMSLWEDGGGGEGEEEVNIFKFNSGNRGAIKSLSISSKFYDSNIASNRTWSNASQGFSHSTCDPSFEVSGIPIKRPFQKCIPFTPPPPLYLWFSSNDQIYKTCHNTQILTSPSPPPPSPLPPPPLWLDVFMNEHKMSASLFLVSILERSSVMHLDPPITLNLYEGGCLSIIKLLKGNFTWTLLPNYLRRTLSGVWEGIQI